MWASLVNNNIKSYSCRKQNARTVQNRAADEKTGIHLRYLNTNANTPTTK